MVIADGKKIQEAVKQSLKEEVMNAGRELHLAVVYVGSNAVIDRFVETKKKFGEEIGVVADVFRFEDTVSQDELIGKIRSLGQDKTYRGIIVQLPLPKSVDAEIVLNTVTAEKDIDVLSLNAMLEYAGGKSPFIPAVPGAIEEILREYNISLEGKKIVVVGSGRLVGAPVCDWLQKNGIIPQVVDKDTQNAAAILHGADIIISGAGSPHFIKPDMVKEGAVLIDAGTSEHGGKLTGDIDPACAQKASLFTPVPGGVGPVTIAILFRNLLRA